MHKLVLAPTSLPHSGPMELIAAASAAGYEGVGLRLARSPNQPFQQVVGNRELIRDIRQALSDGGLYVLDGFSYWIEPVLDLDEFKATFEVAAQLGTKYILVLGNDPDEARLVHNFGALCEAAATFDLTSSVEFAINRPLATLQQAMRLIADSGAQNAVICVDPINLVRTGGSARDLAQVNPNLLHYAHFCDGVFDASNDAAAGAQIPANRRCLPGDGILPLAEILDALPADIILSVEIPGPFDPQTSAHDHARQTLDATRRFLTRYQARTK